MTIIITFSSFSCSPPGPADQAIKEPDEEVVGDERAVEPLIEVLKDEDGHIRSGAAWALGKIRDKRAEEPLVEALKDENEGVRRAGSICS